MPYYSNAKYSMSGSPKASANRSHSGTELSSSMIVDGFKAGLLARAQGKLRFLDEGEVHMKANHPTERAGDVDLKFMANDTVELFDLIPTGLARIQGPNTTLYPGTTIYVEVTARTGESVLFTSPSEPVSHLAKKINFYNNEVPGIYNSPSFVMYVYNGADPARVHEAFVNSTRYFNGVTIHFPRKDVAAWPEYERAEAEGRRAEVERARADAALDLVEEHRARADAEKSRADANQLRIHELELMLEAAHRHRK